MSDIKRASLEQLRRRRDRGETATPRSDALPVDLPDGFWDTAEPQEPKIKQQVNLRVDPDILEFFKKDGAGHLTRMHSVLRAYVDAKRRQDTNTQS